MAFEWHPQKAQRNLEKHGVTFEEAATVFEDPFAEFLPDLAHSVNEDRYICLAATDQGKFLVVAFTEQESTVRIISAREMTPRERRAYETRNPSA